MTIRRMSSQLVSRAPTTIPSDPGSDGTPSVDVPLDLRVWPDRRVATFPVDRSQNRAGDVEIATPVVDVAQHGAVEIDL